MVNITNLFIAYMQAPGETGSITLVTFFVQIVTEYGISCKEFNTGSLSFGTGYDLTLTSSVTENTKSLGFFPQCSFGV